MPLAILSNSSLFFDPAVQVNLKNLDIIVAKLEAPNKDQFQKISRPAPGITFEQTIQGIKTLRQQVQGKFALQIMFMHHNKDYADELAALAHEINPDEVQINTPLRPCQVAPLSKAELTDIEKAFKGLPTINVYTSKRPMTNPLDKLDLLKRRRTEV